MAPKLLFNQSSVTFHLWCITYNHWSRGICHPKSLDIAPNITSQHTLWAIRGGPKRMQRFWSVISTRFLIEYHLFFCCIGYSIIFQVIWHQVHQVWVRRFDSRANFRRQCHFQNVLLFPPQAGLKQLEFISSDGVPLNVDKSIIALTLKRKTIWMKPKHSLRNSVALNSNCLRGKSSTLWQWHCLRKIALESKRLIHT